MRFETVTIVGSLMLSALACSADPGGLYEATAEERATEDGIAPQGASAAEATFAEPLDPEALAAGVITAEESELLTAYFDSGGREPTSIQGRMLHWEDAWSPVDAVLELARLQRDAELTDKAYVNTVAYNPPVAGSTFQFTRPEIHAPYWIVVPNGVPVAVFNALKDVVAEFPALIGNDCLLPSVLIVARQSTYDAQTPAAKEQSFETQFRWIPLNSTGWTCESGADACGSFPFPQSIFLFINRVKTLVNRMALGSSIQVASDVFPANDIPKLKRILRHEIGHTFGLDHAAVLARNHHLPGTTSCGQCLGANPIPGIMQPGGRDSFTADDIKAFRTLYSDEPNRANDECPFAGTRSLTPLP